MNEESFAPNGASLAQAVGENDAQISENPLTPDEFAAAVDTGRQNISYHLRQGLLKRFVDSGEILTDPYRIPARFVDWFLAQNKKKSAKSAKVYAQTPAQMSQILSPKVAPIIENPAQVSAQNVAQITPELIQSIVDLNNRVLKQADEITQVKAELEQKKSELVVMNNERANYNSKLQKYNDNERDAAYLRGEAETLRKELQALKEKNDALTAQLEASTKKGWLSWFKR